jgi:hypothetical protein
MKSSVLVCCIAMAISGKVVSQTTQTTDQVIEGGKIIVELVKALSTKKGNEKDPGCKGRHADLCIENSSSGSISVILEHRASGERREVVILPEGKECVLQARTGVWSYDLRVSGSHQSLRKGDVLIEGCNNLLMNIK